MSQKVSVLLIGLMLNLLQLQAQNISGTITDAKTKETLIGAVVTVKGTSTGVQTDFDGRFSIEVKSLPSTLTISLIGYQQKEIVVNDAAKVLKVELTSAEIKLKSAEVTGSRISEKQKENPLTVESMDMIAIKQAAQNSFYEALGTLKGVDLTTASLGFTVVNTRGFNSTSPVRSLQIIDGVDNQSPGLNFSLGNFLGASDLDVMKVELVAGASTAYYGPNAFNGVISMNTRSPFIKPGIEIEYKMGERDLSQIGVRWAYASKNKFGRDIFGYKINLLYMKANDWEANNLTPTIDSRNDANNPGGYDAVNVYGDEYYLTSDFSKQPATNPGLITYYRTGYAERDLVDYNTENLKLSAAVHIKLKPEVELILSKNAGTGSTVYQGDNRYSLKNIYFLQNRVEVKKQDKYFIRAYSTREDAGQSYDAYFTALLLQQAAKPDDYWSLDYRKYWANSGPGNPSIFNQIRNYPNYPQPPPFGDPNYTVLYQQYLDAINPFLLENYYDSLTMFHNEAHLYSDTLQDATRGFVPFYAPGTQRFDSMLAVITSKKSFSENGSRFYDKSALYHIQGEYIFTPAFSTISVGGNYRMYRPNSDGTIFSDSSGRKITNQEYGVYVGAEKKVMDDKLKINLTARLDKNENFDYNISPAASLVYTPNQNNVFRISFGSAIRNPTLTDQYLYYNVGRAKLIGNISGYDSLLTVPSVRAFFDGSRDKSELVYFNAPPIQTEKVKTVEVGYRTSLFNHLYLDANYYFSLYRDFIGYKIGIDADVVTTSFQTTEVIINNIYRLSSNAADQVSTQGVSVGLNYFIGKFITVNGNYSWNELNLRGSEDPIIPAFNTPRNKFNLGLSARNIETTLFNKIKMNGYSFNLNYKWVQGFLFEGSPQFSGEIESYDVVDVQISKSIPAIKSVFKIGASNVLDNQHYEVFGGPLVGRLAYATILVELN